MKVNWNKGMESNVELGVIRRFPSGVMRTSVVTINNNNEVVGEIVVTLKPGQEVLEEKIFNLLKLLNK